MKQSPHTFSAVYARLLAALSFAALLSGCQQGSLEDQDSCAPQGVLDVVCGFESPEDLVLLPDHSGLLVSEFGLPDSEAGQISLLDGASRSRRVLYSAASSNDLRMRNPIWGDPSCSEPETFSPHGIDLYKRGTRWQLLAVNHAGRESVEMFELQKRDGQWQLIWQGCVEADDDSSFNDVAGVHGGFLVSRMMSRDAGMGVVFDYFLSRPTGLVLHWSLQHGFQPVGGSEGSMPNGLQISSNENIMYLNMYAGKELRVLERSTGNVVQSIAVKGADNSNWDLQDPGKLLVTTHTMSLFGMLGCISSADGNCPVPLAVYELDTESGTMRSLLALDGDYFGAGTAAVRMGDQLFVGSFAGHRVLIAPLGYGVSQ